MLKDFGALLEAGGTTLTVVPEIQRTKFNKNFWNVAFSSFPTLTQCVAYSFTRFVAYPPLDIQFQPFSGLLLQTHLFHTHHMWHPSLRI